MVLRRPAASVVLSLVLTLGVGGVSPALAQTTDQPAQGQSVSTPAQGGSAAAPVLPVDLNRIRRQLEQDPAVRFVQSDLRFYLTVTERLPTFKDFVGDFDLRNGPVPYAGMTHQEFLNQVTPKNLYSSGGITATDMLQWSLFNWAAQSIIKKGFDALRKAKSEREASAIRRQIDRELAALIGR